jgi:hypothetical protein
MSVWQAWAIGVDRDTVRWRSALLAIRLAGRDTIQAR